MEVFVHNEAKEKVDKLMEEIRMLQQLRNQYGSTKSEADELIKANWLELGRMVEQGLIAFL